MTNTVQNHSISYMLIMIYTMILTAKMEEEGKDHRLSH